MQAKLVSSLRSLPLLASILLCASPTLEAGELFHDQGIIVEMPKPFDVRDLEAMLRLRQRELEMISAINGTPLNAAIGNVQGRTADSTALSFRATEVVDPATADASTGIPTLAGQTPFAPTLPIGVNARDLLSEQVSLGHEIINLQLLLNRALSDRVSLDLLQSNDPRKPASFLETDREMVLLGFHIDLLPDQRHVNQVAEVEVRLRPDPQASCTNGAIPCTLREELQPLSLAMMFPEKNVYNVASFTNNSKSIGLGAIAGVVSLGLAASKNQETFYLVKDTDVVAFRGRSDSRNQVFGWQFRPVLGRKTVEPGPRQVYVLLSVANLGGRRQHEMEVEVETCWRPLKRRSQTVGKHRYCVLSEPQPLYVPGSRLVDNSLLARSEDVTWEDLGGGKVLVSVTGKNFDPDTAVKVGGRKLGDTDSLRISGNSLLSFVVPQKALLGDAFQLAGRYGNPFALDNPNAPGGSLSIKNVTLKLARSSPMATLTLEGVQGLPRPVDDRGSRVSHPIVELGGEVFTSLRRLDANTIEVNVPIGHLFKDHEITLIEPFSTSPGLRASSALPLGELFQAEAPIVIGTVLKNTRLGIPGRNFLKDKVSVTIGDTKLQGPQLQVDADRIICDVETSLLGTASQIIVAQGDAPSVYLAIKPAAKEDELKISGEVRQGESVTVRLVGKLAPSVESVRFEDRELPITKRDAQGVQVRLLETVTARAGRRQITAVLKRGPEDATNPLHDLDLVVLPAKALNLSMGD